MEQNKLGSQQVEKPVNSVSGKMFTLKKKFLYRLRLIYSRVINIFPLDYLSKQNFKVSYFS